MKVAVTGIRPTNRLHIGNYFGAIANVSQFSSNYEFFVFCADLYAITDGERKYEDCIEIIKLYMIFFPQYNIYMQSQFSGETCELMWYLINYAPFGNLNRMTQWKDKKSSNTGWFTYPVLMAADIGITGAEEVPTGDDQVQHLEFTRELFRIFNNKYGNLLTIPKSVVVPDTKIMDLKNGTRKMSKSYEEDGTIFLSDDYITIKHKIDKATTDSFDMPTNILSIKNERKNIFNLCNIFKLVTNESFSNIESTYGNKKISDFKKDLVEAMEKFLRPIQKKLSTITNRDVESFLLAKKDKIQSIFHNRLNAIRKAMNF